MMEVVGIKNIHTKLWYDSLDYAYIETNEPRWINRMYKLEYERPEEVKIIKRYLENNGTMLAIFPYRWLKINV